MLRWLFLLPLELLNLLLQLLVPLLLRFQQLSELINLLRELQNRHRLLRDGVSLHLVLLRYLEVQLLPVHHIGDQHLRLLRAAGVSRFLRHLFRFTSFHCDDGGSGGGQKSRGTRP
uniref:Putative secreted protein n=1 Tax=Anopheles marajoara TaxID=58244 RepID=A0A2M4C7F4_9DIPT